MWVYKDLRLQEIEEQRWTLTIKHECQIYESIYDAMNKLTQIGLNPTFHAS